MTSDNNLLIPLTETDIERDTEMGTLVVNYDKFAREDDEWTEAYDRCKQQILDNQMIVIELTDIFKGMQSSEYSMSGEYVKHLNDRLMKLKSKLLADTIQKESTA